jgi:hypothetical protein
MHGPVRIPSRPGSKPPAQPAPPPVLSHTLHQLGLTPPSVVGVIAVCLIGLLGLLFWLGSDVSKAASSVSPPTGAAAASTTTPTAQAATPTPSCNPATNYLEMLRVLEKRKQWGAVTEMVAEALETKQLCSHVRTELHERALAAKLHLLLSQPVSPLNVTVQQQVVTRYRYLQQQAADMALPFPTNLEGAKRAKAAEKFLLSKTLFEEAYVAGEYTKADHDMLKLYTDVLYRLGWWEAQGSDALKKDGLRLLAASYALEQEQGITHGLAWAELRKHCGTDETKWPQPAPTPLLDTPTGGSA